MLTHQQIGCIIQKLTSQHFCQKEAVGGNLYRAKLLLTDTGKQAAEHVRDRAAVAVELSGAGLSDETREIFYTALVQITANLQTLSKEGLPKDE